MPNEKAYLVCKHGRLFLREHDTEGQAHSVDVGTRCSRGKPVALVHTHNVTPHPSPQDLETSKTHGLVVCIDYAGKVKCYKGV